MIDKKISKKITALSVIAIIMVLYVHSFNLKELGLIYNYPHTFSLTIININMYIQNFISQGIARLSVPIFFVISGFVFFYNFNSSSYRNKISKRFYTLLIPYIFWASFYVFIIYILQITPGVKNYFNSELIQNLSIPNLIFNTWISPKNYPLWFLRDLILLVIFSPIISFFLQKYTKFFFIFLLSFWYLNIDAGIHFYNYKAEPILFFSVGSYLALFKSKLISFEVEDKVFYYLVVSYFTLLLFKTFLLTFHSNYEIFIIFLHKSSILLGIVMFWFTLDRFFLQSKTFSFLSLFTFLFFVFQEPFLTITKRGMYLVLGNNPASSLFIYTTLPLLIIILLIAVGLFMKHYTPYFSKIITGNRL